MAVNWLRLPWQVTVRRWRHAPNGRSLKKLVVGFALAACAIPVVFDGFRIWEDRANAIEQSHRDTSNLTRSLSQHAQDNFLAVDSFLGDAVELLEANGTGGRSLERLGVLKRANLRALQAATLTAVIDATGHVVTGPRPGQQMPDVGDRDYFRFHRNSLEPGTHLGAPFRNGLDGRWVIPLSRRIDTADGRFDGVVVAAIDMDFFQEYYETFDIGAHGAILLAAPDGTLLVRRPFDEASLGRDLGRGSIFQAIRTTGPVGSLESRSPTDGVVRFNSYRQASSFPIVVAVAQQKDEVLAPWWTGAMTDIAGDISLAAAIAFLGCLLARRVGLHERAQREVAVAMADYRLLADNSSDMIFRLDLNFVRRYVSPACRELLGYAPEELTGTSPKSMIHPDDADLAADTYRRLAAGQESAKIVGRMRHRDGRWIAVEACYRLITDPATGSPVEITGSLRNVSERVAAEAAVRDSEARYRLLADTVTDVIMRIEPDGRRSYVSPACRDLVGYEPDELTGALAGGLVHPDDRAAWAGPFGASPPEDAAMQATFRLVRKDGSLVWVEARRRFLPGALGFIVTLRDVSARKRIEEKLQKANRQLENLARLDGLTGLANRRSFDEILLLEFQRATRDGSTLALIMIDVDFFKRFNDRYGHPVGDECLRAVARAIGGVIHRPGDVAARYGGEEIAVVLPNTTEAGAQMVAETIRQAVASLKILHDASPLLRVTVSVGVAAVTPVAGQDRPEDLLVAADQHLYDAKSGGRNRVCVRRPVGAAAPGVLALASGR